MANETLWFTIDWRTADAGVPPEHQETLTQILFRELNGYDEVEQAERVPDPEVPTGAMGAHWLGGLVRALVKVENLKKLGQEIQERLPGKPLDFEIEVEGKRVSVKGVQPGNLEATLDRLVAAAKELAES